MDAFAPDTDTLPSPHRIWVIDEVVRNVLAHLPPSRRLSTLASCARVSSALSEPALDLLWRKLSGLLPLFQLLPSSAADVHEHSDTASAQLGTVDEKAWARFVSYAARVRQLHYHNAAGPAERLGSLAYVAMLQRAGGHPLLPRLEELSWFQFSAVSHVLPFLSSSLRRVRLYTQYAPPAVHGSPSSAAASECDVMCLLSQQSPFVEELALDGAEFPSAFSALSACTHLRKLHLRSLTTPPALVLQSCASMKRLESLSLHFTSQTEMLGHSLGRDALPATHVLPALRTLTVSGCASAIADVLANACAPHLDALALSAPVGEMEAGFWGHTLALVPARFGASLRTLTLECGLSGDMPRTCALRSLAFHVRPLLAMRELRSVTCVVDGKDAVAVTDEDVQDIAAAWPGLVSLTLTLPAIVDPASASPEVTSLTAFARHCPELAELAIAHGMHTSKLSAWDTARGPTRISATPYPHASSRLRSLWLPHCMFSKTLSLDFVRFVKHHFPQANLKPMVYAGLLLSGPFDTEAQSKSALAAF